MRWPRATFFPQLYFGSTHNYALLVKLTAMVR